jgi:flagellar biosynthetic protein FlhB
MAEQEQSRSENATPFKLQEAKRKGQVPKSLELNSLCAITALVLLLYLWGGRFMQDQLRLDAAILGQAHMLDFEAGRMMRWLAELFARQLHDLVPLLVVLMVVAIGANFIQTGPIFTTHPLKPDIDRINPVAGLKRLFTMKLVFELIKNLVKLALFATVLYIAIRDMIPALLGLLDKSPLATAPQTLAESREVMFKLAAAFALIAIIDVVYTRWQFNDKQKMSRREVRDEVKHREGDPRIRARMRELRRETLARSKAMQRLPEADVLITNPTHLAIALLYKPESMSAPEVIAKGAGEAVEAMKALARKHRVPIVENRPLAQALFARTAIDQRIPDEHFPAIAKLLVWVYARRAMTMPTSQSPA